MKGRRIAAGLCVALAHALVILAMLERSATLQGERPVFESLAITLPPTPELPDRALPPEPEATRPAIHIPEPAALPDASADGSEVAGPISLAPNARVDWPIEAQKSAKRVLEAEAEAERVARMFSGPGGTWASLTKRQRSKLKGLRWKPGANGIEYDEKGNQIFHVSDGCVLVNLSFFACTLGKKKVYGDMFQDMQKYFDEQRLPETDDGNGTEPEALRPAH